MRITGGIFKGKRLFSPKVRGIHLTEEKVRKAIFDVLGNSVENAIVLELFAGSGALGLEAISRGAKKVFFVDNKKKCIEAIRKNIPEEIKEKVDILPIDCFRAIDYLVCKKEKFDLIILDPPYKRNLVVLTLKKIAENSILLRPKALIIVEHHREEKLDLNKIKGLSFLKEKKYGETSVSFLRFGE